MVKLTIIDAIIIIFAVVAILPEQYINPERAPALYNGIYGFTRLILTFLVGYKVSSFMHPHSQINRVFSLCDRILTF